jgi:hypothetical protein
VPTVLLLFKLIIGHALVDYSLQNDTMAKFKNRHILNNTVPWYYFMTAHALINAGMVWAVTGNVSFGIAELVLHWVIDFAKCEKWINVHADQGLHILCKLMYVLWR